MTFAEVFDIFTKRKICQQSWLLGFILIIWFMLFPVNSIHGQNVTLVWEPSENPNILGYKLYRANSSLSRFSFLSSIDHPDSIYVDEDMQWDTHYYYAVTSIDKFDNESSFSNIVDTTLSLPTLIGQKARSDSSSSSKPTKFQLFQNHPNPFNTSTKISYTLPKDGHVALGIYNANGEKVITLFDGFQFKGDQTIEWHGVDHNGSTISTGVYFVHLKTENQSQIIKILLTK